MAFTLINSATLSSAGSFDFTAIPNTYKDLFVLISARDSASNINDQMVFRFNNDSGTNYRQNLLYASDTSIGNVGLDTRSEIFYIYANGGNTTGSTFSSNYMYITDYASSNKKNVIIEGTVENNSASGLIYLTTAQYTGTSAIDRITISSSQSSFVAQSSVYIYGITNS